MGQKRGRAEGSFVRETRAQTVAFYRDLVQNLKAWQARPPQIRTEDPLVEGAAPSPPDLLPLLPANRMLPRTNRSSGAYPTHHVMGNPNPSDFPHGDLDVLER